MVYEVTFQIRVGDIEKGQKWYQKLLNREPDFIPHDGFAEWELIPGCWLQVAEGTPLVGSGPIRLGVNSIEKERERLMKELKVEFFNIFERDGVPAKWGTFHDPWGNQVGFFEYLDENEKLERIQSILG
ncbi:VOC family protein [Bacillus sp. FJAT-49705]|uniref:VOC family protein n=1 Tax=Cytobacillus citreus TaxID=2833586 RepID=A0ABS5NXX4_9BACI|nr:VOC family protein [Cytobacillus citreus]MBS4192673.1 VOC family protein [Cytobacillus citreus]